VIPVYIGYDRKETIAYHVLSHSLLTRSSEPLQIIPLNRRNIRDAFYRPRGEYDSTDFSNSRWIVPHLQGYEGWAIFMDCDMLARADIAELWSQRDDRYSVMVKKHCHVPTEQTKFLGAEQTKYMRKNWSSLVLFNCARCKPLTRHIVNTMTPGLWFHQFKWLPDDEIGEIQGAWNLLVDYDEYDPDAKLVHFTSGGPWHGYETDYTDEWEKEVADLLQGDNPIKAGARAVCVGGKS
jgi:hypothetical protein